VSQGSYIVATDGIMEDVYDVPHGTPSWKDDNPAFAARAFAKGNPEFELEEPPFLFNETKSNLQTTYWPSSYLRRK
jgi:cephalosporin hydroxylase